MECVLFLISIKSQPQNPDFRNNHERFLPITQNGSCNYRINDKTFLMSEDFNLTSKH